MIKEKTDKLDLIQMKTFCSMKDLVKKDARPSYGREHWHTTPPTKEGSRNKERSTLNNKETRN